MIKAQADRSHRESDNEFMNRGMKIPTLHVIGRLLAGAFAVVCIANATYAQNFTVTTAPIANWVSVASSADGNKVAVLAETGGAVYVSTNAGIDWTLSSPPNGFVLGSSIACSADGRILVAAGFVDSLGSLAGQIYRSTNSGATWNVLIGAPYKSWTSIACSADGTQIAGASAVRRGFGGGILTSVDGGLTWTFSSAPNDSWIAIASSADGSKLVAADNTTAFLYTSADFGNTWAENSPPPQAFGSLASSADGIRLVAASENNGSLNGPIFISTNSGKAWTQTTAPVTNWVGVASSANGSRLVAVGGGTTSFGHVYVSSDSGATWNQMSPLLAHWSAVTSSADGNKLVATVYGGHIYVLDLSQLTLSPTLHIEVAGSEAVISWLVPSSAFALQQNSDLANSNWVAVTSAPTLNVTNLHNEVRVTVNGAQNFYRLVSH